jgi:hypothetical protein
MSVVAPWTQIADVARQRRNRRFPGKAVLHVSTAGRKMGKSEQEDTQATCPHHRLCTALGAELAHQGIDVEFYGVFTNV